MSIDDLIENIGNLPEKIKQQSKDILSSITTDVVNLNQQRILKGISSTGEPLEYQKPRSSPLNNSGAYTRQYSNKKAKQGGQTRVVDFKLDGTFLRSLKATSEEEAIVVESSDEQKKVSSLLNNYNEPIGLSETDQEALNPKIADAAVEVIQKALFNGL